jgi:hypothetical protein
MQEGRSVIVMRLRENIERDESMAGFGEPIDDGDLRFLASHGLQDAVHKASHCLGWIWRQWLAGASREIISEQVEPFVERGLILREKCRTYAHLPLHDLLLLHCAIFGSDDAQLEQVTETIADATGDKGYKPQDNGELYAAAWSGMMKYWILGKKEKVIEQSNLIWRAQREPGVFAAAKPLVIPWVNKDWARFIPAQQNDFAKLWNRARNDSWTVQSENSTEIVVTTQKYQIEQHWCWAHCGIATLAEKQGVNVLTDPFWFPPNALGPQTRPKPVLSHIQLDLF